METRRRKRERERQQQQQGAMQGEEGVGIDAVAGGAMAVDMADDVVMQAPAPPPPSARGVRRLVRKCAMAYRNRNDGDEIQARGGKKARKPNVTKDTKDVNEIKGTKEAKEDKDDGKDANATNGKKRAAPPIDEDAEDDNDADDVDDIILVHEVRRRKMEPKKRPAVAATANAADTSPNLDGDEVEYVGIVRAADVTVVSVKGPMTTCGICFDDDVQDLVRLGKCRHGYCRDCLASQLRHIALETKKYPIECPGCTAEGPVVVAAPAVGSGGGAAGGGIAIVDLLDDDDKEEDALAPGTLYAWKCVSLLRSLDDEKAADALAALVVEKEFLGMKRYCSNPRCATPFEFDGELDREHARIDCALCKTATCVLCSKAWHDGRCAETEEEKKLRKDKRYKSCPKCENLVEKSMGCNFIRCRCGTGFCFKCGKAYKSTTPNGNGNPHGTPGCKCGLA